MLTVIGFSVHDTIVVFDRIRENRARHAGEPFAEVVNHSILQTLARSIMTSFTVVLTLLALLLFGGSAIQNFVLALLIGIISGTYSSIFNAVAAPGRLAELGRQAPRPGRLDPRPEDAAGRLLTGSSRRRGGRNRASSASERPAKSRCSRFWHPDAVTEPRFRWQFPGEAASVDEGTLAAGARHGLDDRVTRLLASRGVAGRGRAGRVLRGAGGRPPRPDAAARRRPRSATGSRARGATASGCSCSATSTRTG